VATAFLMFGTLLLMVVAILPLTPLRVQLASLAMTVGGASVAVGIFILAMPAPPQSGYRRRSGGR